MNVLQAVILGIIQGLTEFIPISSSAHLIIVPWLFGWEDKLINSLTFDVALHFGTPQQRELDRLSVDEARRYIAEGHFAKGSMLPKVEAAVEFAASRPGRSTLITLLGKAREGIDGRTGTRIG